MANHRQLKETEAKTSAFATSGDSVHTQLLLRKGVAKRPYSHSSLQNKF
jgi:hypothetical protein